MANKRKKSFKKRSRAHKQTQRKQVARNQSSKKLQESKAWLEAEWEYSELVAMNMFPFVGKRLTVQDKIKKFSKIVRRCPEFYHAQLQLGTQYIIEGKDIEAREHFTRGFESLKTHFPIEDYKDIVFEVGDFLEERFRYHYAIKIYQDLFEHGDELGAGKAVITDYIAYCYAMLGDIATAFEYQNQAIAIDDTRAKSHCNLGWKYMIQGDLENAKSALEKSLELDPDDEVTKGNYTVVKLLLSRKKMNTWQDFLLRPIDYRRLDKLKTERTYDKYDLSIREYNRDRMEAFKSSLIQNTEYQPQKKYDLYFALKYIFDIVWKMDWDDEEFLYDNIDMIIDYFEHIMYRLILKTGDIDEEIFNDTLTGLLEFYKFLEQHRIVSNYQELVNVLDKNREELKEKMQRYNEVRHDPDYDEDDLDELRDELFEGAHLWLW